MRAPAIVVLGLALSACNLALDPPGIVITPRILAITVDHPEAAPGQDVSLRAMISVPEAIPRPLSLAWTVCLDARSILDANGFDLPIPGAPQCDRATLAPDEPFRVDGTRSQALFDQLELFAGPARERIAMGTATDQDRQIVGLLGILATAGLSYEVGVDVVAADGSVVVAGFKRAAITTRTPVTTNPPPVSFRVGAVGFLPTGRPFECTPFLPRPRVPVDTDVELEPVVEGELEPWLEEFPVFDYTGGVTILRENAYYSWFASGDPTVEDRNLRGSISVDTTQPPDRRSIWHTPPAPGPHSVWLVVRDGHLGTSACEARLFVGRTSESAPLNRCYARCEEGTFCSGADLTSCYDACDAWHATAPSAACFGAIDAWQLCRDALACADRGTACSDEQIAATSACR